MRKTKVVCTLGPAADSEEIIRQLICSGMNAARFNFSHGTHESHLAQLTKLKRVRDEMGVPVATILDTKGPEIRIKTFEKGRHDVYDVILLLLFSLLLGGAGSQGCHGGGTGQGIE